MNNKTWIGAAALLAAGAVRAGTMYWDGGTNDIGTDGDGASGGAAGMWNTSILNWDQGVLPHVNWTNTHNDSAVFAGAAGAVSLGTNVTVGGLQFDTAGYTIRSNTLTFGADGTIVANADATISSALGGSAAIVKSGAGALTLSNNATFTGALILSNGTLKANGNANALGTGAATLTLSGGTLDFNHTAALSFGRNTTVNGDVVIVAEKAAAGAGVTYTLGGLSIGSNTLTVSGGNVNSGTAGLTFVGAATLTGPATLNVSNPVGGGTTLLALTNTTDNGGHLLTVDGNGNINLNTAVISGNGGLTKNGSGVLQLGGVGTPPGHLYLGTTTINGGVVRFQNATNSGFAPGNLTINAGVIEGYFGNLFTRSLGTDTGQVQITGGVSGFSGQGATTTIFMLSSNASFEVVWGSAHFNPTTLVLQAPTVNANGKMTLANRMDLNGATRTIAVNGGDSVANDGATLSGTIRDSTGSAAVGLIKNGVGQLLLTGTNIAYSGDTTINGGRLTIGYNSATVFNGGNYSGAVSVAGGAILAVAGSTIQNLSGVISGGGGVTRGGYNGTLVLSGSNTYAGKTSITPTTTAGGTLVVSSFNSVNGGTPLLAGSSLGCPTNAANGTIDFGSGGAQASVALIYTNGAGETTDRVINFLFNGSGVSKTLNASGSGLLKFTSTFTSVGSSSTNNDVVLTGVGGGELVGGLPFLFRHFTKSGAGTWTLGGAVQNFGTATVSGGTLLMNGTLAAAAVNVTGGTLGGTGVIGGTLTNKASVAPGASAGMLTINGDYQQAASGALMIEIGGAVPGTDHDVLTVGNTATLAGALNVALTNGYAGIANNIFTVLTAGVVSGTFATTNLPVLADPNLGWDIQYAAGAVVLSITNAGGPPPPTGYNAYSNLYTLAQGPEGDDDGDGFANLYEYVTGSNPTNGGSSAGLSASRTNGLFALKFMRDTNTVDATLIVEGAYASTNEAEWIGFATNLNGSWGSSTNVTELGGPVVVDVTIPDTAPPATNRFLRLRITRP